MKKHYKFLSAGVLLAATVLASAACAPVKLLNGLTPSSAYSLEKDVPFSAAPGLLMDIYTPKAAKPNAPLVMFIYGGGWNSGHKDMYKFIGEAFSSEGYTTLVPNYRTYPEVIYPDFMTDAAKAVAHAADTYKRPIVLVGHSAGAHISSLLALNPEYLNASGADRCKTLAGWIGLAGPYDFKVYDPPYTKIFPPQTREEMLPIKYAGNALHPAMVIIGSDDETVQPAQTGRMAEALRKAGVPVTEDYYDGVSHTGMIANMSKLFENRSAAHSDVMAFLQNLPKTNCG